MDDYTPVSRPPHVAMGGPSWEPLEDPILRGILHEHATFTGSGQELGSGELTARDTEASTLEIEAWYSPALDVLVVDITLHAGMELVSRRFLETIAPKSLALSRVLQLWSEAKTSHAQALHEARKGAK